MFSIVSYINSIPRIGIRMAFVAWRNVWRSPLRSSLTLAAMVVGLSLMIVTAALMDGMVRTMTEAATDINLGHAQIHQEGYIETQDLYALMPPALLKDLEASTPHLYAPRLYAAGLASAEDFSGGALLKAVDPSRETKVSTLFKQIRSGEFKLGRASQPGDEIEKYWVVIGGKLARNLRVQVGGEIVLLTQAGDGSIGNGLFLVAGILKPTEGLLDRMGVVLSMEAFQSLMAMPAGYHEFAVRMADQDIVDAEGVALRKQVSDWKGTLPYPDNGSVKVRTWKEINPALSEAIALSSGSVFVIMFIIFSMVAMVMLNTMLMAVHERRREFGILLALGMGRMRVMGMVMLEALVLNIAAALVGSALGVLWALHLETSGLDFRDMLPDGMDWAGVTIELIYYAHLRTEHVVSGIVIMVCVMLLAALVPSWRTTRYQPAQVIHQ